MKLHDDTIFAACLGFGVTFAIIVFNCIRDRFNGKNK